MKGTLHHQGNLHTLRFERRLAHPPEKVWRALTDNAELVHWFPAQIRGARQQGAKLRFVFQEEGGPVLDNEMTAVRTAGQEAYQGSEGEAAMVGEMTVYDPPRTLEYTWNDEILRWELQPRDGYTLLLFTHTFEEEAKSARDASGWEVCLDSLERRLAGLPPETFTMEHFNVLFDDYAQRFGAKASARREPDTAEELAAKKRASAKEQAP
jgi:uncharacterized protein YndB with AHSA1/START domain